MTDFDLLVLGDSIGNLVASVMGASAIRDVDADRGPCCRFQQRVDTLMSSR